MLFAPFFYEEGTTEIDYITAYLETLKSVEYKNLEKRMEQSNLDCISAGCSFDRRRTRIH